MPPDGDDATRRLTLVVGAGRSGTSTLAVSLKTLGMHVPQPEVIPDDTNPKGFGESQWVVDFHNRLLRHANVVTSDARPSAWLDVEKIALEHKPRERAVTWLERQFSAGGGELIVKDPRLSWFLPLWQSAAVRCDARPLYLTMLRSVTEVVRSRQHYYSSPFSELNRVAAWVNMMLHTERATRGADRAFIRYDELLEDWTRPLQSIGERFGLRAITGAHADDILRVHDFIDPSLRRIQATWDDMDVPLPLRELADETAAALDTLAADPTGSTDERALHDTLDELWAEYERFYQQSEAIAESSTFAAQSQNGRLFARDRRSPRGVIERIARRVPYGVRERVPPAARRRIESAVKRFVER